MSAREGDGEAPLFPDLPIVDSQHHLVDRVSDAIAPVLGLRKFLIDDYVAYLGSGHNVIASVAVEGRAMYRADGPVARRPVGETEFLNGQAAMAASGCYGRCLVAAGIVASIDFCLGDDVVPILAEHIAAAPRRLKGVRQSALWDADPTILGGLFDGGEGLYRQPRFRSGFRHLAGLGLSFDAFVLAPQLADVVDLARAFPDTSIILNHAGQPIGVGRHAGRLSEEYGDWRAHMTELARCPNVAVKLGGLGSYLFGSASFRADPPATSETLAAEWRPFLEVALDLFGAGRCMFESNRPTDSGDFNTLCNAQKRIMMGCSQDELRAVFATTADRVYRLDLAALRTGPTDAGDHGRPGPSSATTGSAHSAGAFR